MAITKMTDPEPLVMSLAEKNTGHNNSSCLQENIEMNNHLDNNREEEPARKVVTVAVVKPIDSSPLF
jgi:hypothetical protein